MNIAHYSAKFDNVTFKDNRESAIRVRFSYTCTNLYYDTYIILAVLICIQIDCSRFCFKDTYLNKATIFENCCLVAILNSEVIHILFLQDNEWCTQ